MPKAKATVIAESAIIRSEPMPEIPTELHLPENPSWDRARAMIDDVRRSIGTVILLGFEIRALREQYFAQGSRTDMLGRVTATANVTKGWNQAVQDELDISHMTAYRIMERAESLICMRRIEIGESVEYNDTRTHQQRVLEPTPELQQQATAAIEAVVTGAVAAPRAWAGLIGESARRAGQNGSVARAAVNHHKNIMRSIISLRSSFKHWRGLHPNERAEIETIWRELQADLPETIKLESEI